VSRLRAAGIRRLNLDLIFGIPGSTLDDWRRDLEQALALEPDHLSCYGLVFEPGTPLAEKQRLGRIEAIDDGIEAEMYDLTRETLASAGFEHYEISNWSRPGEACRHNLVYWTAGEWIALGPAAAGNLRGVRYRNLPRLDDWIETDGSSRVTDVDRPDADTARGEVLMLGLRLRRGMPRSIVEPMLSEDPRRLAIVNGHLEGGRLEWHDDHLRIAEEAVMLADGVLSDLV
jgi:oxygen-independent coproporphyrinogen-3 oxidase